MVPPALVARFCPKVMVSVVGLTVLSVPMPWEMVWVGVFGVGGSTGGGVSPPLLLLLHPPSARKADNAAVGSACFRG